MKPLILVVSMLVVLIAGCSSQQSVLGPDKDARGTQAPCSINAKLC